MEQQKVLDYDCIIRKDGTVFHVTMPTLGILCSGEDLMSTWSDCREKGDLLIAAYEKAGMLPYLPKPNNEKQEKQFVLAKKSGSTGSFLLHTMIIVAMISGLLWLGGSLLSASLQKSVDRFVEKTDIGGGKFWSKVEREIERAANKPISPEKEMKVRNNIRKIVAQLKPYVDEISPLFTNPSSGKAE